MPESGSVVHGCDHRPLTALSLLPPIIEDNSLLHRHFNNLSVRVFSFSFRGNLIELDNWRSQVQQNNKSRATAVVCKMSKIENGIKHCEIIWQVFNWAAATSLLLRVCVPWVEELCCCAAVHLRWMKGRSLNRRQNTAFKNYAKAFIHCHQHQHCTPLCGLRSHAELELSEASSLDTTSRNFGHTMSKVEDKKGQ